MAINFRKIISDPRKFFNFKSKPLRVGSLRNLAKRERAEPVLSVGNFVIRKGFFVSKEVLRHDNGVGFAQRLKTQSVFAVIAVGGRQYKVVEGDIINVDHSMPVGQVVKFRKILLIGRPEVSIFGTPFILGAGVTAQVTSQSTTKVKTVKHRRRKNSRTIKYYNQPWSTVKIQSIWFR